ncbi:MAG: selenocysteine-specific translation elongation factor [Nitrospirota bacterium]|jgi:selenocysteine-specific elongation factor
MRYVILGTAGHIDHGKSWLVQALTGINPDRLKEEKERGITIDLGFADLEYEDLVIGVVDVPGHERLVKNMLAGAGGIDIVLLVIAADEGIMPQSREHLHICNLLRIKTGLVAITKADLVEPEWLELVEEEVRQFVAGTFLEGAEVVPVSAKSGFNLDVLKQKIHDLAMGMEPKPTKGIFRLPVDRVFTLRGFGTVVTGTAVSGSVGVEEVVEILPRNLRTKIRGLQSHGKAVTNIHAGQRAALNLQGVEKEDLRRGDTLVAPDRFTPTWAIDAKLELLAAAPILKSRDLVHFHLGTAESVARVILYDAEELRPGESLYCQFRLKGMPVVAQSGDRYIVRRFSPVETIGGGEVLDPSPHRRRKKEGLLDLEVFEKGELAEKIAMKVRKARLGGMDRKAIEGWVKAEVPAIGEALNRLTQKGVLLRFEELFLHRDGFAAFKDEVLRRLQDFHRRNPLRAGIPKEELRARLRVPSRVFSQLLQAVQEVEQSKEIVSLKGFAAAASEEEKARVVKVLDEKGYQPPSVEELSKEVGMGVKQTSDLLKLLSREGSAVRINDSMYLGKKVYDRMLQALKAHFGSKGEMTVSEFRDILGTSRKYALPILEYLDSNKITLRVGDVRKLLLK